MSDKCRNPYCDSPNPIMRSPSSDELRLFKSELDMNNGNLLDKGFVKLMVCEDCGVWTAALWDQEEQKYINGRICLPFQFDVGTKVRVTLRGKRFGIIGTVSRRMRWVKLVYPPPVPENLYWVLIEKDRIMEDESGRLVRFTEVDGSERHFIEVAYEEKHLESMITVSK